MSDVAPDPAQPTADVLPVGVRRRWGLSDAWLPAVLTGELLAGVLLGLAWNTAASVPDPRLPVSSTVATSASTTTSTVVVPPAQPSSAPPPPPRTEPRNPFAAQTG